MKDLAVVEDILRNRQQFLAEIGREIALPQKMRAMLSASFVFLAVYGALLGLTHSPWQMLSSALKLPLLFLATLIICAPALYMVNILFGSNQPLHQSLSLVLMAITITAALLLSFAPITLFLVLTFSDDYQFFKLLNVALFSIAGGSGAVCLKEGLQIMAGQTGQQVRPTSLAFYLWSGFYIFVGSQMAWTLRPFFGYPQAPFELFRQFGGNFYTDILASLGEMLGFVIVK